MSRRSRRATPTLVSELNVLSTTPPVFRFLILVRTTACPLPGLWCWNSTTSKRPSGRWTTMPRRRSFVFVVSATRKLRSPRQVRQVLVPVARHDEKVLDAHAADAGQVHAGLDGDHHARLERPLRPRRKRRSLVDVETDTVAGRVHEMLRKAVALEGLARRSIDGHALGPRLHGGARRFERADDGVVHLHDLRRSLRSEPRACGV